MKNQTRELRLLSFTASVGEILTGFDRLPEALQHCAEAMVAYLDAACAGIWTGGDSEQSWQLMGSHCLDASPPQGHSCMSLAHFDIALIAGERKPYFTNNVLDDDLIADRAWAESKGLQAFAAHPLMMGDRLTGIMAMFSRQPLPAGTMVALETVSRTVALGIERRKQEELLLTSELDLRDFFDNSVVPLHMVDADGRILKANEAELQMLGYARHEYVGRNIAEFYVDAEVGADIMRLMTNGENVRGLEARMRCQDGSVRHVLIDSNVCFKDGRFLYSRCFTRDITRRKQVEEALRISEERYDLAMKGSRDGIWDWNIDTGEIFYTERVGELLGYNPSDVAPMFETFLSLLHPEDRERVQAGLQRHLQERVPYDVEYRLRKKDGSYGWFSASGQATWDEAGRPLRMAGSMRDISERKSAEEKLLNAERRFRAVFDQTFEFIGLMTPDGVLIEANKTALSFIGMEVQDVVGRFFWDTPWWTHNQQMQEILKKAVPEAAAGKFVRFEADHADPQGRKITVDFSLKPVKDDQGNVVMLIPEGRDITERKRAELKLLEVERDFRQLADNIPEVFWISSPGGKEHFYVSPAYETIWGRPCKEIYERPDTWFDAILPEDAAAVKEHLNRQLQSPHPQPNEDEYRIRRPDGTVRWVWARTSPVLDENGNVIRVCGIAHDVTQRKEVERRVSEFYSMVSHELRTPLTSIRAALGLIEGGVAGVVEAETLELVQIARAESDRLIRLINDILDIRKIEAGRLELQIDELAPRALVAQTLDAIRGIAQEAGISLVSEIEPTENVLADRDRIVQVLTNLISNAIKFSPSGSEVKVKVGKGEGNMVRFSIRDNGPGIPESKINKLFGLFQQLDSSDTRAKGGTGLGLAISKAFVERHKGRIGLDTLVGQGTTFWFELPPVEQKGSGKPSGQELK